MKYAIRVQAYDSPGMDEGDPISIRPAVGNALKHGGKNAKMTLLFIAEMTEAEKDLILEPEYKDGKTKAEAETLGLSPVKDRRYNIPLETIKKGWCPDLDLKKVRDPEQEYYPKITDVDTSEKVAFCKDKVSGVFKYSTEKVAK